MDSELEVIRDQMDQTRCSLSDKLEVLESQVHEKVLSATETVSATVDEVKDVVKSVTTTVESVLETLNVSKHVEEHPWGSVGCAIATGFVGSLLLGSGKPQPPAPAPPAAPPPPPRAAPEARPAQSEPSTPHPAEGIWNTVTEAVKGMAVASVLGTVRHWVKTSLPSNLHVDLNGFLDDVEAKLGVKPAEHAKTHPAVSSAQKEETPAVANQPEKEEDPSEPGASPRLRPHNGIRQRVGKSRG